jgi:ADP-ribose pyrophosphatase
MKTLYEGSVFSLKQDGKREYITHPGAAVILPLLEPNIVLMIKNKRFAVGKTLWELPAGTLEPDEIPLMCAKRELEEETGFKAKEFKPLLEFYSTPGFSNEKLYAFVAEGLKPTKQKTDPDEEIEVHPLTWTEILSLIKSGEIVDGKTLTVLMHYILF